MQELFNPKTHDKAIETTCSNLIMARLLLPKEVPMYFNHLSALDDYLLAQQLIASRLEVEEYLEHCWSPC